MSTAAKKARRTLLGLFYLTASIFGILAFNVYTNDKTWLPGGAIDIAGGREIVLEASNQDGTPVDQAQLDEAVGVFERRINGSGVAEAEVTTINDNQIKVSLPGTPGADLLALITEAAQLQFRPVIYVDGTDPASTTLPAFLDGPDPFAIITDETPSSYSHITDDVRTAWAAIDCTTPQAKDDLTMGLRNKALVACAVPTVDPTNPENTTGAAKYILGPVELDGADLKTAISGPAITGVGTVSSNDYQVSLEFKPVGTGLFKDATTRLYALLGDTTGRNQFAMVLDGEIISAPQVAQGPIEYGNAFISRPGMSRGEAELLATQLKYGSIPLQLELLTDNKVSATLGDDQLQKGLLAGGIGLILVVLYSLLQYRALAMVTVGSLVIAGALTMGTIGVLSALIGYRLSLAGVAGLIVAIGITADSFIVYFERVRDELREGRSLPAAIDHGWSRAKRTIIASDMVSLLAAGALYMTAVGGVRGFAFTLGLTTIIDLIVVTRFTHPILILLGTTEFFGGGHRFSGLDPRQLGRGGGYKGRGRVEAAPLTLAERKAAVTKGDL